MDTLAIIGTLASIVNRNGVTLVDNINDEIENALRARTAFDNAPLYTTLTVSLITCGVFEDFIRRGVRYSDTIGDCSADAEAAVSAVVEAIRDVALNGGRPLGCNW